MKACIETVASNRVGGWAFNVGDLDERLTIALVCDGRVIAETKADKYREDLKMNGVGDGRFGYVFADIPITNLPSAYLSGRIQVLASGKAVTFFPADPADYLRKHLESTITVQTLESSTFNEFLASFSGAECGDSLSAARSLSLLNAGRAHFPEWIASAEFLELAVALATNAKQSHSQHFYQQLLRGLVEPSPSQYENKPAASIGPNASTYGSLLEWSGAQTGISMEVVEPRFFASGIPQSFLAEAEIFRDEPTDLPKVKVLAIREYAFGESSWYVKSNGKEQRVARTLYYLDFELLRSVIDEDGFVLIDMSNEGPEPDPQWISVLNRALQELAINSRQVILVTQNLKFAASPPASRFLGHVANAHFFISKSIQILKGQFPTDHELARHCSKILTERGKTSDESLKHYICLNFTPRWSRWATVLHLSMNNLLDKGYVSFPGNTNFKLQSALELDKVIPQVANRAALLRHAPSFIEKCPLELDIQASASSSPDFTYPIDLTTKSLVHIVTESEMSDGLRRVRVTEKVLKPIVGLQPFLVVGNPESLSLLKAMGFRTFDAIFDEGYDSISDPASRLDAIFSQIDRIANLSVRDLREQVSALNETLIHNFLHLMVMGPRLFNDAVRHRLLKLIEFNMANR